MPRGSDYEDLPTAILPYMIAGAVVVLVLYSAAWFGAGYWAGSRK